MSTHYKLVLVTRPGIGETLVKTLLDAGVIIVGTDEDGTILLCAPDKGSDADVEAFVLSLGIRAAWIGSTEISKEDLPWQTDHGALIADLLHHVVNNPLAELGSVAWPNRPRGRHMMRLVTTETQGVA